MRIFNFIILFFTIFIVNTTVIYAENFEVEKKSTFDNHSKIFFLTASRIGSYYSTVNSCIKNDKNILVKTSKGSLENFKYLKKNKYGFAIVQEDVLDFLSRLDMLKLVGKNSFKFNNKRYTYYKLDNYKENILFIGKINHLVDINSLNNKSIAIGQIGTGSNITGNIIKTDLWEKKIKFKTVYYTSITNMIHLLNENNVDFAIIVQKLTPALKAKLNSKGLYIIRFQNNYHLKYLKKYCHFTRNSNYLLYVNPIIIVKEKYNLDIKYLKCMNR